MDQVVRVKNEEPLDKVDISTGVGLRLYRNASRVASIIFLLQFLLVMRIIFISYYEGDEFGVNYDEDDYDEGMFVFSSFGFGAYLCT